MGGGVLWGVTTTGVTLEQMAGYYDGLPDQPEVPGSAAATAGEFDDLMLLVWVRRVAAEGRARAVRVAAGLSCAEVASAVGVSREAVHKWEAGDRVPRGAPAVAWAGVLRELERLPGVDVDPTELGRALRADSGGSGAGRDRRRDGCVHDPAWACTACVAARGA